MAKMYWWDVYSPEENNSVSKPPANSTNAPLSTKTLEEIAIENKVAGLSSIDFQDVLDVINGKKAVFSI